MNKKAFTLVELLAVIVILAVIALIAVPGILNMIEKARIGAFKDSILSAYDALEYTLYSMGYSDIPEEGISIDKIDIKSDLISGKFMKDEEGNTIAHFIKNKQFCAYGKVNDLLIKKDCNDLDTTYPNMNKDKLVIQATSNSVNVELLEGIAEDIESGIKEYKINLYQGNTLIKKDGLKELGNIRFSSLTSDTDYKVEVLIINGNDMEVKLEKNIRTVQIPKPTYEVTPSGWAQSKTVKIIYPSGYTNEYSLDGGTSWIKYEGPLTFKENADLIARTSDEKNSVTSDLSVSEIDSITPSAPTLTGGSSDYVTSPRKISVATPGVTGPSGLKHYRYIIKNYLTDGDTSYISSSQNGVEISGHTFTITNADPFVNFEAKDFKNVTSVTIVLEEALTTNSLFQIYYRTIEKHYDEANSVLKNFEAGTKEITIELPKNDYYGIRFDFESALGKVFKVSNFIVNSEGTTDNEVSVENKGYNTIKYKTVNNLNIESKWSAEEIVKIS